MAPHQPPLEENIKDMVIDECVTNPEGLIVLSPDFVIQNNTEGLIDVVNKDLQASPHAYMRIQEIPPIDLSHHYPGWGIVYFGVILPKVQEGVYRLPTEEEAQKVAIKRLSKAAVVEYLQRGGNENPFKEIQRMQWLGDNHHVLGLVEVLHDDSFLYIIMPYCEGGSLVDWIFNKRDKINEQFGGYAAVYLNILENLEYIHSRGVCHRDLSPDNCMVLANGRIVFVDLAMSFLIPPGDFTSRIGEGFFGKSSYLPPEVVSGFHYFGARSCDLWSSAVVLFNLVTGEMAWQKSLPSDARFKYLVVAKGMSRFPINERTIEILEQEPSTSDLRSLAEKCVNLNPGVADLLEGILRLNPTERWTTEEAKNCLWLQAFRELV